VVVVVLPELQVLQQPEEELEVEARLQLELLTQAEVAVAVELAQMAVQALSYLSTHWNTQ
jgi:hypothetical protein